MLKEIIRKYFAFFIIAAIVDYGVFSNFRELLDVELIWQFIVYLILAFANFGLIIHLLIFIKKNKKN